MSKFYFIGGPKPGQSEAFFRRLTQMGGPPQGWQIYPHVAGDGRALHVIDTETLDNILDHLRQFEGIYEWREIIEIIQK